VADRGGAHTNPVFVLVDGKPILPFAASEWVSCVGESVWTQEVEDFEGEREAARKAYEHARQVYRQLIGESPDR